MTDPTLTAEQVKHVAASSDKPLLASWMGGAEVAGGQAILNRAGIPTFSYPDTAAQVFAAMWRSTANLRSLYETPQITMEPGEKEQDRARVAQILEEVQHAGRTLLTEPEFKTVLPAYGILTVEIRVAINAEEAVHCADEMGYPVALKLWSETLTHKSDVGGVQLDLTDAQTVHRAYQTIVDSVQERARAEHFQGATVQLMIPCKDGYELIVGSSIDPQFGPVLLFGSGGQLVEVFRARALALPPLTLTLTRRLMEQTRIRSLPTSYSSLPFAVCAALDAQRWHQRVATFCLLLNDRGVSRRATMPRTPLSVKSVR